jgi:hypothetical protein
LHFHRTARTGRNYRLVNRESTSLPELHLALVGKRNDEMSAAIGGHHVALLNTHPFGYGYDLSASLDSGAASNLRDDPCRALSERYSSDASTQDEEARNGENDLA